MHACSREVLILSLSRLVFASASLIIIGYAHWRFSLYKSSIEDSLWFLTFCFEGKNTIRFVYYMDGTNV